MYFASVKIELNYLLTEFSLITFNMFAIYIVFKFHPPPPGSWPRFLDFVKSQ